MSTTTTEPKAAVKTFRKARGLTKSMGGDLLNATRDLLDGKSDAEQLEILESALAERPHMQAQKVVKPETELLEAAFGERPTLAARGKLMALIGAESYAAQRQAWGASDTNLKPGKNPEAPADKKTKREAGEDQSGNPWSASFPEKDRVAAIQNFIRTFGAAASARMAKAAGSDLAGRPLRAR